jgi:hypothetical protein
LLSTDKLCCPNTTQWVRPVVMGPVRSGASVSNKPRVKQHPEMAARRGGPLSPSTNNINALLYTMSSAMPHVNQFNYGITVIQLY